MLLKVGEGLELQEGRVNVSDEALLDNVRAAIRRGLPQVFPQPAQMDRVVLLGGGPSLESSLPDIRQAVFEGAKLVTMNGSYQWAIDRNLKPACQIVMDARAFNARFLAPHVPACRYLLASQCHPASFDAVAGYPDVWIFHAVSSTEDPLKTILDAYYAGQWVGVGGGITVALRAINLLRMLGYLRFDVFGVDSCWLDGGHHAYAQPENDRDKRVTVTVAPPDRPDLGQVFQCSPWHLKQAEGFVQQIRLNGDHFLLRVHGPGLLAHLLQSSADAVLTVAEG